MAEGSLYGAIVFYALGICRNRPKDDAIYDRATKKTERAASKIRGKQTTTPAKKKGICDDDIIVATASSAIPLRDLDIKSKDVVIDVAQQMQLDRDQIKSKQLTCIICKEVEEVAWKQTSYLAQTTVRVLAYGHQICAKSIEDVKRC